MALPKAYIPNSSNIGMTLLEVLIVTALFALLSGLGLFFSLDTFRGYTFRSERNLAVSVLQRARGQAMSNIGLSTNVNNGAPHGVHVDVVGGRYVVFQGASYNPGDGANIYVPFTTSSVSHSGMTDVVFNQLDGSITAVPAALHLQDGAGHVSDISFTSEGTISWTN